MIKKALPWLAFIMLGVLLIIGYASKKRLTNYTSELMKMQTSPEIKESTEAQVNNLFNYTLNGKGFELTLLEFGSTNCRPCKQMEPVLEEIRTKYTNRINVVFYHVMKPESQNLIKYFGVSAIPYQIILDKNGKEIFSNYGFISAAELEKQIEFITNKK